MDTLCKERNAVAPPPHMQIEESFSTELQSASKATSTEEEDTSTQSCVSSPPEISSSEIISITQQTSGLAIKESEQDAQVKRASAESSPVSKKGPEEYQLKWIMWHDHKTPIITQNQNGPCPLIAIANILLLRGKMKLSANATCITAEELLTHVANNIVESRPEVCNTHYELSGVSKE